MIRKSTSCETAVLVALGAILGSAAATVDWSRTAFAHTSADAKGVISAGTPSDATKTCCSSDLVRGSMLALAEHKESVAEVASQAGKKPNILVIFGDDIGQTNVSAYSMGLMGFRTPNIDRIAREGMIFTDYYAEQSCTAGRSSFITGQCTFRT
jgi:hypothetical protein